MSNRRELLEKLREIGEECSDIESNATRWELSSEDESDHIESEKSDAEESDEEAITNDENEDVINVPRKRRRVIISSDEETEDTSQETETAADWCRLLCGRNLTKAVFPEGYHLRVFSRV